MGDKINIGGDATGAAVGSHASLKARDITAYKQGVDQFLTIDEELKQVIKAAREAPEKEKLPMRPKVTRLKISGSRLTNYRSRTRTLAGYNASGTVLRISPHTRCRYPLIRCEPGQNASGLMDRKSWTGVTFCSVR